jgi:hypothetical protein
LNEGLRNFRQGVLPFASTPWKMDAYEGPAGRIWLAVGGMVIVVTSVFAYFLD